MEKKKILITVKTSPLPSKSSLETVCTAGFTEDGEWIRLYPVDFRMQDKSKQYKKYDWIEVDVEKRDWNLDFRKESHRCVPDSIVIGESVGTEHNWEKRKEICIDQQKVFTNFSQLYDAANTNRHGFISLAVFRPAVVMGMKHKNVNIADTVEKQKRIMEASKNDIFRKIDGFKQAEPIDVAFQYYFKDDENKEHCLSIEDWELTELYRKQKNEKGKKQAIVDVKQRYEGFIRDKDLYFFLGTRLVDQIKKHPACWSIIGVFYPPKEEQLSLF